MIWASQSITMYYLATILSCMGFPGGTVVKNPPANAGDADSIPGSGKSHGERSLPGNSPQGHKRVEQGSVTQQQQNI